MGTRADDFGNLGLRCFERREVWKALCYFRQELQSGGDPLRHACERWTCWMLLGEYEQAWLESDRLLVPGQLSSISACSGHLLVRCLRGLGDAIQFLRYGPLLRDYCSHLTVQVPDRLMPLLSGAPWLDTLLSCDANTEVAADYQIECSDLPYLFRSTVSTIPPPDNH